MLVIDSHDVLVVESFGIGAPSVSARKMLMTVLLSIDQHSLPKTCCLLCKPNMQGLTGPMPDVGSAIASKIVDLALDSTSLQQCGANTAGSLGEWQPHWHGMQLLMSPLSELSLYAL